jgi:hypothetical protein
VHKRKACTPRARGEQPLAQHIRMHVYELGDASLYESGKPFISHEYETIICLCPGKAEVPGSNPGRGSTQ